MINVSDLSNVDAERRILGAILKSPDKIHDIIGTLSPTDFYRVQHRCIYNAMLSLVANHQDIDLTGLVEELRHEGKLQEAGGVATITNVGASEFTSASLENNIKTVLEYSKRRALVLLGEKIAATAGDVTNDLNIEEMQKELSAVSLGRGDEKIKTMKEYLLEFAVYLEEKSQGKFNGILSGIAPVDIKLKGFQPGDLDIIAARPSMGKTAFVGNMALNAAKKGKSVAFFSLEMGNRKVLSRILAMETGINSERMLQAELQDEEWDKFMSASERLSKIPLFLFDRGGMSVSQITSFSRKIRAKSGLDLIIIDYLQLIIEEGRNENRTQELSKMTRSLKNLAKELNVPVIVLSQLSRAVENRNDKRPMLSDLRESGSIEQDADVVIMLYRDDYYNKNTTDDSTEFDIKKRRDGATGMVRLKFVKELTKFVPYPQDFGGHTIKNRDIPV